MRVHVWTALHLCPAAVLWGLAPSYPAVLLQSTAIYFDLLAVKPKKIEEAVLSWLKPSFSDYLVLNKTQHAFVAQLSKDSIAAVMTSLDSCNFSASYKEPKNCYEK